MTFVKMGFRNLFRQKRRTAVSLAVVILGAGSLLLALGHSRFIEWGLRESIIHSETGHFQVFHSAYFQREEKNILEFGLENPEPIRTDIERLPDVSLVLARIDFMGLLSNGDKSVACLGQGLEPDRELRLRGMFRMSGKPFDDFLAHRADPYVVALGRRLADSLTARPGDYLTLMTTTAAGALNALDLKVIGSFAASSPEYEERAVVVPLRTAQELLRTAKVKNLIVALNSTARTDSRFDSVAALGRERGYSIALKKWHERTAYYKQVKQFYDQITGFLTVVLIGLVLFATANTIMMSVTERTREIGTFLSLGTTRLQSLTTLVSEGGFIGVIGGLGGAALAFGTSALINALEIRLPPAPGMTEGYPLMMRNEGPIYLAVFAAFVLVTAASSFWPAWRVSRLKIVDALGHI
jgi:putative ABC transport system permease protein